MEKQVKKNGENISSWKKYYELERIFSKVNTMRGILKRACQYVRDDVLGVHQMLVDFEQDYGTSDLLEKAIQKQIEKYQEIKDKEEKEEEQLQLNQNEEEQNNHIQQEEIEQEVTTNQNQVHEQKTSNPNKRKAVQDIEIEEDITKKVKPNNDKVTDQDGTKPTVFIKNLPSHVTEAFIMNLFENKEHIKAIRVVKSKFGGNKGIAYADFSSLQEATNACLMMNDALIEGQKLYVALSAPPKKQTGQDNSTAYLKNLPYTITEDEIKLAFPGYQINQVRMIRDGSGDFKGFAYVEFTSEQDLVSAMDKFNQNPFINKRKIVCEKSEGSAKDRVKSQNNSHQHDQHNHKGHDDHGHQKQYTIFLKNLGFKVRESDVQDFFKNLQVDSVVIAKDQDSGQPKGFGFVTFQDKKSYDSSLKIGKGTLRGREFEIQKYTKSIPKKETETKEINEIENKSNDDFKKYFQK